MLYITGMEDRRIPVSFRVSSRFKRCLMMAAKHEQRSQTNLIEKLLFDYCKQAGLDPDLSAASASPTSSPMKKGNS